MPHDGEVTGGYERPVLSYRQLYVDAGSLIYNGQWDGRGMLPSRVPMGKTKPDIGNLNSEPDMDTPDETPRTRFPTRYANMPDSSDPARTKKV